MGKNYIIDNMAFNNDIKGACVCLAKLICEDLTDDQADYIADALVDDFKTSGKDWDIWSYDTDVLIVFDEAYNKVK